MLGTWSEATVGWVGAERPSGTWSEATVGWVGADRLLGTYVERSERSDRRVWGIVCDTPKVPRGSLIRVKPNLAVVHLCAALSLSFVSGTITSINTLLCCREYVRSVEYERIISEEEGRSPAPRQEQEGASGVLVAVTTATGVVRRRGDGRRSTVDGRRSTPRGLVSEDWTGAQQPSGPPRCSPHLTNDHRPTLCLRIRRRIHPRSVRSSTRRLTKRSR